MTPRSHPSARGLDRLILNAGILWTIGLILIGVGIILAILGMLDRAVGPRRHYY